MQDVVGGLQSIGFGGMNIDPTIFQNKWEMGSAFPAQIRVQLAWECPVPLSGQRLFEIIAENLGYRGQPLDLFRLNRKDIDHGLNKKQVDALMREFCVQNDVRPFMQANPRPTPSIDRPRQRVFKGGKRGPLAAPLLPPKRPRLSGQDMQMKLCTKQPAITERQQFPVTQAGSTHVNSGHALHDSPGDRTLGDCSKDSATRELPSPADAPALLPAPHSPSRSQGPLHAHQDEDLPPVPNRRVRGSWKGRLCSTPAAAPALEGQPQACSTPQGPKEAAAFDEPGLGQACAVPTQQPHICTKPPEGIFRLGLPAKEALHLVLGHPSTTPPLLAEAATAPAEESRTLPEAHTRIVRRVRLGAKATKEEVADERPHRQPAAEHTATAADGPKTPLGHHALTPPRPHASPPAHLIPSGCSPDDSSRSPKPWAQAAPEVLTDSPGPLGPSQGAVPEVPADTPGTLGPSRAAAPELPTDSLGHPRPSQGAVLEVPTDSAGPLGSSQQAAAEEARRGRQEGVQRTRLKLARRVNSPVNAVTVEPVAARMPGGEGSSRVPSSRGNSSTVVVSGIPSVKRRAGKALEALATHLKTGGLLDAVNFIYMHDSMQAAATSETRGKLTVHVRDGKDGRRLLKHLMRWRPDPASKLAPKAAFQQGLTLEALLLKHGGCAFRLAEAPSAYRFANLDHPVPLAFFRSQDASPPHMLRMVGIELQASSNSAPDKECDRVTAEGPRTLPLEGPGAAPPTSQLPQGGLQGSPSAASRPDEPAVRSAGPCSPGKVPSREGRGAKRPAQGMPVRGEGPRGAEEPNGKKLRLSRWRSKVAELMPVVGTGADLGPGVDGKTSKGDGKKSNGDGKHSETDDKKSERNNKKSIRDGKESSLKAVRTTCPDPVLEDKGLKCQSEGGRAEARRDSGMSGESNPERQPAMRKAGKRKDRPCQSRTSNSARASMETRRISTNMTTRQRLVSAGAPPPVKPGKPGQGGAKTASATSPTGGGPSQRGARSGSATPRAAVGVPKQSQTGAPSVTSEDVCRVPTDAPQDMTTIRPGEAGGSGRRGGKEAICRDAHAAEEPRAEAEKAVGDPVGSESAAVNGSSRAEYKTGNKRQKPAHRTAESVEQNGKGGECSETPEARKGRPAWSESGAHESPVKGDGGQNAHEHAPDNPPSTRDKEKASSKEIHTPGLAWHRLAAAFLGVRFTQFYVETRAGWENFLRQCNNCTSLSRLFNLSMKEPR
eukprot:jgi/Botrbrau1/21831/Bobra.0190s0046.2